MTLSSPHVSWERDDLETGTLVALSCLKITELAQAGNIDPETQVFFYRKSIPALPVASKHKGVLFGWLTPPLSSAMCAGVAPVSSCGVPRLPTLVVVCQVPLST